MLIIFTQSTDFELCVREKKERNKKNKIGIFMFDFLDCEKD